MHIDDTNDDSSDTQTAIRQATYRALCEHGYAATTIEDIAGEFAKSKSLLYYHYENKETILTDFLRYLLDQFVDYLDVDEDDPRDRLWALLDRLFPTPMVPADRQFRRVIVELRSHATHSDAHRDLFVRADRVVHAALETCIERGIESGQFERVDPSRTARTIQLLLSGGLLECALVDDSDALATVRACIDAYVRSTVFADSP